MLFTQRCRVGFLPGSLVSAVGQLVGDDLRSVEPPQPEPLRLIHAGPGSARRLGVEQLRVQIDWTGKEATQYRRPCLR